MHYNTDQLRDYHFGLLENGPAEEITAHLGTCAECSAGLEQIRRQFAALDLLKVQPEVPEKLIAEVLRAKPPRKTIPFRTVALLAAAASIAIVFGINLVKDPAPTPPQTAHSKFFLPKPDRTASGPPAKQDRTAGGPPAKPDRTAGGPPALTERTTQRAVPSLAELRAEKPFAPASNIELNILPRRDDVQLTIYNAEDLTLVRETRRLTLKRGWNWLQFMWSNTQIDPTSLSLEPKTHADQIEITQLVYPPRLNELARWTIFSEFDGEAEFELTYFTCGLQWKAFYEATLAPDEQTMQLRSFVRVDNASGEDYENAQTRLVVGEINLEEKIVALAQRQYPYGAPDGIQPTSGALASMGGVPEIMDLEGSVSFISSYSWSGQVVDKSAFFKREIIKQALSEYQLYTIEGHETIPDGWGKRLPSFDVQEIGVTNLYKFDEERWGPNAIRFLSFANTETCKLGETPLPNGFVRMFRNVERAGNSVYDLSYIGATGIKYIPVGEEVELELGPAQQVVVEPRLMRTRTDTYQFNSDGEISGWDETTNWTIEINNTRDLPVEVEITRATGSNDWNLRTDDPFEKYDAGHIRFTVRLEPWSKKRINYELTVRHGTRK